MSRTKKEPILSIDTIIVILIAICVMFLNSFTNNLLSELDRVGNEAMFIKDELNYKQSEELGEEIVKYRPDSCKMIEIYNESFELIFSLQFDENHVIKNNNILSHPDLVNLFQNNAEGQTSVTIGEYDEDVYFQWIANTNGEKRLVIVYSTIENVKNIWVFSFVCYLVLILVFILLIRVHNRHYNAKIIQYKNISDNFRYEVNNR